MLFVGRGFFRSASTGGYAPACHVLAAPFRTCQRKPATGDGPSSLRGVGVPPVGLTRRQRCTDCRLRTGVERHLRAHSQPAFCIRENPVVERNLNVKVKRVEAKEQHSSVPCQQDDRAIPPAPRGAGNPTHFQICVHFPNLCTLQAGCSFQARHGSIQSITPYRIPTTNDACPTHRPNHGCLRGA
jgi:hypothetical protein